MTAQFESLDEALEYYWDLMLTDPEETLSGVNALLASTPASHERYPHIQFYKACCFIYLGQLQQALAALDRLLVDAEDREDLHQQRRVQNSRGMVLKSLGRFAEGAQALEKSAELCRAADMLESEIPVRLNLANLFLELDDQTTAQEQMTHILTLPFSTINDELSGELEFLKARLALGRFDFSSARDSILNALSAAEKLGYNHLRVNTLTIQGRLERLQGNPAQAIATLKKAIDDPDFENEGVLGVTAYIELIKALLSEQDYDSCAGYLSKAQAILAKETNSKYQSQITELQALWAAHQQDYRQAYYALQEASRLKQSVSSEQVKHSVAIERFQREESRLQSQRRLAQRENELLKASQQKLEVVNEFARELASTRDTHELGHAVYRLMRKHFDAHIISMATNDEVHRCLTYVSIVENNEDLPLYCLSYNLEDSRMVETMRRAEPLVFHDDDPIIVVGDPNLRPRSQLYLPLILNGDVMGVLSCQSSLSEHYQGENLDLILAIAPFLTLAVDNARSHEHVFELNRQLRAEKEAIEQAQSQIEHMANHDMLTDLPNRRALDERLDQIFESQTPFAFAYIDLDGFKPINDQHGHAVGDAVLKVISQRLRNVLRKSDFAARIGGDEFVLILFQSQPDLDITVAMERVLDSIRQPISIDQTLLQVSASIGVVTHEHPVENRTELLHFSDQAMYEAKRSGEGGVYFFTPTDH